MKKLHLLEDVEEVISQEVDDLQASTLVSSLIKTEWDTVDLFNAVLITLKDRGLDNDIEVILNEIITDHYKNIGQLEKCLQVLNANTLQIEDGKEKAEEIIED